MKEFRIRTQSSRTGNVNSSRPCQWAVVYLDKEAYYNPIEEKGPKIEIDGTGDEVVINIHTEEDWLSIPVDLLLQFLRMKDEELSNLFLSFKRIKYSF